jgi:hypothetical protein
VPRVAFIENKIQRDFVTALNDTGGSSDFVDTVLVQIVKQEGVSDDEASPSQRVLGHDLSAILRGSPDQLSLARSVWLLRRAANRPLSWRDLAGGDHPPQHEASSRHLRDGERGSPGVRHARATPRRIPWPPPPTPELPGHHGQHGRLGRHGPAFSHANVHGTAKLPPTELSSSMVGELAETATNRTIPLASIWRVAGARKRVQS